MSLVLTAPSSNNYAPAATLKAGLHKVVISNVEDLGMVPLSADLLLKNRAQAAKEGRDPNSVKTEQPKARIFFSNSAGEFIAKDYTLSLHDRSGLKKDLDAIGKSLKYGDTLASLVGTQAQLFAVSKTSAKGKVYVTVGTLAPAEAGQSVNLPATIPATPKTSIAPTTGIALGPAPTAAQLPY